MKSCTLIGPSRAIVCFQPRRERGRLGGLDFALRAHHDDAKAGSRLARQISQAPSRIMGIE